MSASLSGKRIGNLEIGARVGAGGMGEVYRARDTRLNRDVAVKVLLPSVAGDPERLARFEREAQLLASLNHPHIAHIHGVESGDSGPLLVMEFIGGATLADRVVTGPLPIDEAVAIARQIADALEAAHERGIVHRDLKPANIKVADDGTVKVLDFGLAKALDPAAAGGSQATSPTITSPAMTQAGVILGTAAYMSPEQAKGRAVDKRSDVWAFGCVLFEMLTGRRAFEGEDVTETIAAIVRGEPDWTLLPADTPQNLRTLLQRALDKDRRTRMSDISVARFLLSDGIATSSPGTPPATRRPRGALAAATVIGLLIGAAIGIAAWSIRNPAPPPQRSVRFELTPPGSHPLVPQGIDRDVAIAPDGSFFVYRSGNLNEAQSHLVLRYLNDDEPRAIAGTTNARAPFISPDGLWVGFQVGQDLRKVPVAGGPVTSICRMTAPPRGASWGDDDHIVYGSPEGLMRVHASGGDPVALTTVDKEPHVLPHVLPGSKWVVFTTYPGSDYLASRLEAIEIATKRRKTLLAAAHDAAFVDAGYLIFGHTNASPDAETRFRASLRAARFDPARVEVLGEPATLINSVRIGAAGTLNYSVSRRGDLVFLGRGGPITSAPERTLVWVDRKERETLIEAPPRAYATARLSPDGARIVLDIRDQSNDIGIWDLNRRALSLLSRHAAQDMSPIWTPDGTRVLWTSTRAGGSPNLFWQPADGRGEAERLTDHLQNQFPTSMHPDGNSVLVFGAAAGNSPNGIDLFRIDLRAPAQEPEPILPGPGLEMGGEISPDGRWLAYHANESGEFHVYVRPYPDVRSGRWQISTTGGTRAMWSKDGRELFYVDREGQLTSVRVSAGAGTAFVADAPRTILKTKYHLGSSVLGLDLRAFDVSADGQRFLMIKEPPPVGAGPAAVPMTVVLNWSEDLRQRLPEP